MSEMSQREESFWAWGHTDEVPEDAELEEYKEFLEEELGFPERPILRPVDVEEVELPETEVSVPDHLADFCTQDKRERMNHTYGSSRRDHVRAFRGNFEPAPDVVAKPTEEEQIEELLQWAADEGVAVIPYGGGTGVVGGTEGDVSDEYAGVLSLDMRDLDQVIEVDEESRVAHMEGGLRGPEINDRLAEHGLHLRHYPQSYEFATLGGMIATRSGGHYATRYTHIDDFVENARMITPGGTFQTNPIPASGAGPDPNRIVLGSEGTLGVVTEARIRVEPRPIYRSDASVQFSDLDAAVDTMREVTQARLYPANCRLHDENETKLFGMDMEGHLVVLGFESADHSTESRMERALEICEENGGEVIEGPVHYGDGFGRTKDEAGSTKEETGQAFITDSYTRNHLVQLGVVADTIETSVTWDRFHEYHDAITTELQDAMDEVCGGGFLTTRFTHVYPDGPAPYIRFFAPGEPGRELEQHYEIKDRAMQVVQEFDLTTTHHHAIGRDHKEWYTQEIPENFGESIRVIKNVLDPSGIMNPGVLVDP